jgi:hypothetical protein
MIPGKEGYMQLSDKQPSKYTKEADGSRGLQYWSSYQN